MSYKRFILPTLLFFLSQTISAQWNEPWWLEGAFKHLDAGVTVSSTGIGAEVTTPVGDLLRLRTGFTVMPHFKLTSNFPVEMNGVEMSASRQRRMKDMMANFLGYDVADNVDMNMHPTVGNFKFLIDVMPIPGNKHWNVTLGFYAGPSRVGKAVNAPSATATLMAVNVYNTMYQKACKGEPMIEYEDSKGNPHSADLPANFTERLVGAGMMGMPLGTFADGDKAMMVADRNFRARAEMKVNKFRPYVGLGYNTAISADGMWNLTVDAGLLFWGGTPHVYVDNVYKLKPIEEDNAYYYYDMTWIPKDEDGRPIFDEEGNVIYNDVQPLRIDLARDVTNVRGKVGDMVETVKKFKVCPSVGITISRRIF